MIRFILINLYLFLAVSVSCMGQEYPVLHYTVDDGLPSNTIYAIYSDCKGFLWIATDKGLARYDGQKFRAFTTFDGLADNEIMCINEDSYHRIWLGCYNGALCYYQNDTFYTARNKDFLKLPYSTAYTFQITNEYDSSVIISFFGGYKFMEIKGERCKYFDLEKESKNHSVYLSDNLKKKISSDKYCLQNYHDIVIVDTNGKIKEVVPEYSKLRAFTVSQNHKYIYGSGYFFDSDDSIKRKFPPGIENSVYSVYTNKEHIFYASKSGLYIDDTIHALTNQKASCVNQDITGNYWIGTQGNGIYCLENDFNAGRVYKNAYEGEVVYTTSNDSNIYFITDDNKVFSIRNHKVTNLISGNQLLRADIKNKAETAHLIDSNNTYYGFGGARIWYMDNILSATSKLHIFNNVGLDNDGHKSAFMSGNTLYVRRFQNMYLQPKPSNGVIKPGYHVLLTKERIFSMKQPPGKDIWYTTTSAIYKFDGQNSVKQQQFHPLTFKDFEFAGSYLVGYTFLNELMVCNNITGSKMSAVPVAGQNCIWDKFYKIDSNHLLISTNNNYRMLTLYRGADTPRYDIQTLENPFLPLRAEAITTDGNKVCFFKNGDITSVKTSSLFQQPATPILYFTTLTSEKNTYPATQPVDLGYAESRSVNIGFAAVSFSNPHISCEYSVSKDNQFHWKNISGEGFSITNLPEGDYKIAIRAWAAPQVCSSPIELSLHIRKPYWATWWFISGLLGATATLILLSVILTRRSVLRKAESKNRQMELELKAIYSQINPHFIFNTLNSALLLVRKQRFEEAYQHISRFSRLLRSYIKSSRNKLITIQEEIVNLTDYLELQQTRFGAKFDFSISVIPAIEPARIKIPSLLLQPFAENAVNHGLLPKKEKGTLTIQFTTGTATNELLCTIDDDGIGRKEAQANKGDDARESYGDQLVKDLISIFNTYEQMRISIDYLDKVAPLTGTTVIISIKNPTYD